MKVHFIAIGGSVMHNLAIALYKKGYQITGSDDKIFDPSYSNLKRYGLLPDKEGWEINNIQPDLDAVILGMHAKPDNPELLQAKELGLKIYSFPEYLYEQTKHKTRVVIGGSHGKTTITSMVMHVLRENNIHFDYMVGSQIEGFETMVHLDEQNDVAVFEGDEYLSSPIDSTPKFHIYKPHIALISGIAWDHINVFPSFENYLSQFATFVKKIEPRGKLIYYQKDQHINKIIEASESNIEKIPYDTPGYSTEGDQTFLVTDTTVIPLHIFGKHNLTNLEGARKICEHVGLDTEQFYASIQSFQGAAKRLQIVAENSRSKIYLDFAHAPSKVQATIQAVKEQYPKKTLVACLELHTFSSLNNEFLHQYKGTMSQADIAFVYYNPETIEHKGLKMLKPSEVQQAFGDQNVQVYTNMNEIVQAIQELNISDQILLFMSSGNFNGFNPKQFQTFLQD